MGQLSVTQSVERVPNGVTVSKNVAPWQNSNQYSLGGQSFEFMWCEVSATDHEGQFWLGRLTVHCGLDVQRGARRPDSGCWRDLLCAWSRRSGVNV